MQDLPSRVHLELWDVLAFHLTKLWISALMSYTLKNSSRAEPSDSCVVAYATMFSVLLLPE